MKKFLWLAFLLPTLSIAADPADINILEIQENQCVGSNHYACAKTRLALEHEDEINALEAGSVPSTVVPVWRDADGANVLFKTRSTTFLPADGSVSGNWEIGIFGGSAHTITWTGRDGWLADTTYYKNEFCAGTPYMRTAISYKGSDNATTGRAGIGSDGNVYGVFIDSIPETFTAGSLYDSGFGCVVVGDNNAYSPATLLPVTLPPTPLTFTFE